MVTESKKYHPSKFTRLVIYPLGLVIFLLILGLVLVMANGYKIEFKDSKLRFIETGMLIVSSRPSDAEIMVDGKNSKKKTGFTFLPVKFQNVSIGDHTVKLVRDGYRTWEKSVSVKSNLVTWLNYALLFPKELKTEKVDEFNGRSPLAQSENRRYVFLSEAKDGINNYYIYDFNGSNLTKIWPRKFVPTETWLKNPVITSAKFNSSNDKLFIQVKNGRTTESAILETEMDGKVFSLNKTYTFPFDKVAWNPFDGNEMFVLSKGGLYKVNVNSLSQAQLLTKNVIDFSAERDRNIYFVQNNGKDYQLVKMPLGGLQTSVLAKAITKDTAYRFSYSSFADAIALLPTGEKTLTAYYKLNNQISSIQLASNVESFGWSRNGRRVYYYGKSYLKVYDWEREEELSSALTNLPYKIDWYFDDAHIVMSSDKGLVIMDYDGTNMINFTDKKTSSFYLDGRASSFIFSDSTNKSSYNRYNSSF